MKVIEDYLKNNKEGLTMENQPEKKKEKKKKERRRIRDESD
jgi:hypothetical protein